ncbi:RagB/SusD family nutrient uptake outer membrane protein [Dinghuibacter silviterrae]|uniref:Putative outer membrane starch-binding protein n=1 Tax=Dinghuibacter silviterrae TaxID=1539049 RepID=A0A4R8DGY0_9BACT|nr:RagB/SusD family nutrient uptake outer membrane protein [Dinghuibacter silviterrae]TDW96941.1 putative outer membrane starch-binding protein [Dinghuibacter silviterrae]
MKKLIYALAAIVILASCNKRLNEYNPSNTTADALWSTPQGFVTAVNGAYSWIPFLYGNNENGLFLAEPGTDLWYNYNKVSYDIDLTQYQAFTSASNPCLGVWTTLYKAINQCNAGIGRIDQPTWPSQTIRNERLAELRFLRGFYYWWVVESFGNVILDTVETTTVTLTAQRSPVTAFYDLIIRDLQYAAANLPVTYGNGWEYGRATQGSAEAMLARAYLSRAYYATGADAQTYFKAAHDAAVLVINNQAQYQVSLYQNYASLWDPNNRDPNNATHNQEALFVATFSTNTALDINSNADRTHMWFLTNYSGYSGSSIPGLGISLLYGNDQKNRRFMPTRALLDFYNDTIDARYTGSFQEVWLCNKAYTWTSTDAAYWHKAPSLVGHVMKIGDTALYITKHVVPNQSFRPYAVFDVDTTYFPSSGKINYGDRYVVLKKYLDPLTRTGLTSYPGYLDVIILRLGEMYLDAAEADLQMSNTTEAAQYINVLRTRAAVKTPVDYTAAMQVQSSQITLDFILDERAREMCGEYCRWFDLKRTGKLGSRIAAYNPDVTGFIPDYALRPVPLSEIQALSNGAEFGQNPGY